jgi:hypothetical protein
MVARALSPCLEKEDFFMDSPTLLNKTYNNIITGLVATGLAPHYTGFAIVSALTVYKNASRRWQYASPTRRQHQVEQLCSGGNS